MPDGVDSLRRALLAWYDRERRDLPWRAPAGGTADPYRVWVSEIMLQQTTAAAVAPRFLAFLHRWPRLADLAAADLNDVLHEWQGLGYYARARNLHACAQVVIARHDGQLPADAASLRLLPGIGPYTAGAIAAIAFGRPTAAVDGNVLRVIARLHCTETPLPGAHTELAGLAAQLVRDDRPGDFVQALMELGASICRPRRPACLQCPWRQACAAFACSRPEDYPRRDAKPQKPLRRGIVFWTVRPDGAVLVRRRPHQGLLGGMTEFPSTPWREQAWEPAAAERLAPVAARWAEVGGAVSHTFTHFQLELRVLRGTCSDDIPSEAGWWCPAAQFSGLALPTVMKKVARLVEKAGEEAAPSLFARHIGGR